MAVAAITLSGVRSARSVELERRIAEPFMPAPSPRGARTAVAWRLPPRVYMPRERPRRRAMAVPLALAVRPSATLAGRARWRLPRLGRD